MCWSRSTPTLAWVGVAAAHWLAAAHYALQVGANNLALADNLRPLTNSQSQTPPSCLSSLFTILPLSQLHLLWSWSAEGEDGEGAGGV